MRHISIQKRANAFVVKMAISNGEKFTIASIAETQKISKPMARRVFMKLATMACLVIELHPYRSNTSEIRFSLIQNKVIKHSDYDDYREVFAITSLRLHAQLENLLVDKWN